MNCRSGARVVVPFRTRAVVGVHPGAKCPPFENFTLKNISEVLDPLPALPRIWWSWGAGWRTIT